MSDGWLFNLIKMFCCALFNVFFCVLFLMGCDALDQAGWSEAGF